MQNQYQMECNIAQTLNLIGDKWTLLILHEIKCGKHTYKDLQAALHKIPTNLLSSRLKTLEEDGLIKCDLYQQHPPRYSYHLTDSGKDLDDIFYAIVLWGERNLRQNCYKKLVHKKCNHAVKMQYYCEHCDTYVDHEELSVIPIDKEKK